MTTLRDASKQSFNTNFNGTRPNGGVTFEEIQTGCIQRIADATELMAQNYLRLQRDLEYYKNDSQQLRKQRDTLNRRVAALRGMITKLKKRLDAK